MKGLTEGHWLRSAVRLATALALGSTLAPNVCSAASPTALLGSLVGSVQDSTGVPQMGAVVQLYNRHEKVVEKAFTNAAGEFAFAGLAPDLYSIRVTLASFVPALKRNISIQPGMQSVLAINLATVLSSIELVYSAPNAGTLMSEDWKWVLKSSMSTRPVTRVVPVDISDPNVKSEKKTASFRNTRGLVKVSSGETLSPFTEIGNQPDLGTTFALATSLFGANQIQLSGNIGYMSNSDLPAAGFRTSLTRPGSGSSVKVTVQQVSIPTRGSTVLGSQTANAPALRTMSVTAIERLQIGDEIELDYGGTMDSITYLDRLNYFSPFARLNYHIGGGTIVVGYSSGAPPVDLLSRDADYDLGLQSDLAALSVLPRISIRNGRAHMQRSENMELAYRIQSGSREYGIGVYHEFVRNGALTMSSPDEFLYPMDLLPELSSRSSVFNIGNYTRSGYFVSATQHVGDTFAATIAYGRGGALTADGDTLQTNNPDELRSMIRRAQRHWARASLSGTTPITGTRFNGTYEWTDYSSLTPSHVYLTQSLLPQAGLNVRLQQPVPIGHMLPGRLEASVEMRNLLAQGYLPMTSPTGRRLVVTNYPRAVRGGLSFIF
jgi:hypothetical protein